MNQLLPGGWESESAEVGSSWRSPPLTPRHSAELLRLRSHLQRLRRRHGDLEMRILLRRALEPESQLINVCAPGDVA